MTSRGAFGFLLACMSVLAALLPTVTASDPRFESASDPQGLLGDPMPGVLDHGGGPLDIGPSQTYYADLGSNAYYVLKVTNSGPTAVVVDVSWNAPPAAWTVEAFQPDGTTPLPDANGNGRPDVSVGAGADADMSVVVTVPSTPPPEDGIVTEVVATADPTGDTDSAELRTNLGPYLVVDRAADPTVIDLLGSGGTEETTIILTLDGQGTVVEGSSTPRGADIMFVIDDTGSMGPWIDQVKTNVDLITNSILENTTDVRFGVASYKDVPEIDLDLGLTFNVAWFKTAIQGLFASGGGDWPEDPDMALELVANQSWRPSPVVRIVVLIGDAEAHNNNHMVGVAQWGNTTLGIHTSAIACGTNPSTAFWFGETARAGDGFFANLGDPNDLAKALIEGIMGYIPNNARAARDEDPNDGDPMVRDVLPSYIAYVPGTFVDPDGGGPRFPARIAPRPGGGTILEWSVLLIEVNQTWRVSFRVTSARAGIVPTNHYGESRASFVDWKERSRSLPFPEVFIHVRSLPPETTVTVGTPSVWGAPPYVTSATPLWLEARDRSNSGIARTLFRVDGGPWIDITGGGPFTLFPEGEHLVEWFSEDFVGNVELAHGALFRVDDTPPESSLLIGDPKVDLGTIFITTATPLSLLATDRGVYPVGVDRIESRIDGGPWNLYAAPFRVLVEGLHVVEFRAWDRLGNAELPHAVAVYVDGLGPAITVTVGFPSYVALETSVTSHSPIELAAEDPGTIAVGLESLEYRVFFGTWSAWSDYAGPILLSPEGMHIMEVRARDRLGNEGVTSGPFVVDDTPPTTSLFVGVPSLEDGATYITSQSLLTLWALDGGSMPVGVHALEYRIDGGPWSPHADPFALSSEGAHLLEFRAIDRLGNEELVRSVTLIVDNTAPTVSLALGTPSYVAAHTWITSGTPIELSAVDGGASPVGVGLFEYRAWFGSWSAWTPYGDALFFAGEGEHRIEVRAADRLGNEWGTEYVFIVDDTPPEASLNPGQPSVIDGATFVTSATPFTVSARDPGGWAVGLGAVEYGRGGVTWWDAYAPFVILGADGPHTIAFRAADLLGHATEGSMTIVLDNTPPETRLDMAYIEETHEASLTLAAHDAGSGLASTETRVNAGGSWPYRAPIRLGIGSHVVHYGSADRLGNMEPERQFAIVILEPGPVVVWNWTPSVSFGFSVVLLVVARESARLARRKGGERWDVAKTASMVVPFVLVESAAGFLSLQVPALRMPPLLGWASAIVSLGLVSGVLISWLYARRVRPPPPGDEMPPPPPKDEVTPPE